MALENNKKYPKVSIGIVCYGHEKYIWECLLSIKNQNYPNLEVFISDDCSKDDTRKEISLFKDQNPDFPLHVIHTEKNLGVTKNFNWVMSHLSGDYVGIFAGDDIMMPKRLFKQVEALEQDPDASFCYTNVEWFNDRNNKKIWNHLGLLQSPPQNLKDIIKDFSIPTPSILARKSCLPNPPYNLSLDFISDFYLVVELMLKGKAVYIPEVLTRYRKHCDSITQQNFFLKDREQVLKLLRERLPSGYEKELVAYQKLVFYAQAMDCFKNKKTKEGLSYLLKTFPHSVMSVKWILRLVVMVLAFVKSFQRH